MALHIFSSTDAGAPTLSGTTGDLVNLLDKLLVDGYNSQTITITRSGTTATANCTSHGFVTGQRVVVSGADQADYNIEAPITVSDANNFTYEVANSPTTPATGTITAKVAPLGWTLSYTATNKRAWRTPSGTNQFYLRVTDDGTGSAAYGRAIGYETMSDIDTGTGPFPTEALLSGGGWVHKSTTATSTTRFWYCVSDKKLFTIVVKIDGTYYMRLLGFGDFESIVSGDAYNTCIYLSTNSFYSSDPGVAYVTSIGITGVGGVYYARDGYGSAGAIRGNFLNPGLGGSSKAFGAGGSYPYPTNLFGDSLVMGRVYLGEGTALRGWYPGLWDHGHAVSVANSDGNTWSGATGSTLEGKKFINRWPTWASGSFIIETSDTWRD